MLLNFELAGRFSGLWRSAGVKERSVRNDLTKNSRSTHINAAFSFSQISPSHRKAQRKPKSNKTKHHIPCLRFINYVIAFHLNVCSPERRVLRWKTFSMRMLRVFARENNFSTTTIIIRDHRVSLMLHEIICESFSLALMLQRFPIFVFPNVLLLCEARISSDFISISDVCSHS